MAVLHDWGDLQ